MCCLSVDGCTLDLMKINFNNICKNIFINIECEKLSTLNRHEYGNHCVIGFVGSADASRFDSVSVCGIVNTSTASDLSGRSHSFSKSNVSRRRAADSAVARQGEGNNDTIDLEMESNMRE
jgi:hypothetical protein